MSTTLRGSRGQGNVMVGDVYGRWKTLSFSGRDEGEYAVWLCRCDCGTESSVRAGNLRQGRSTSCGCIAKEKAKSRKIHGESHTRPYWAWQGMRARCNNPNNGAYGRYGAVGVRVWEPWLSDYQAFRNYVDGLDRPECADGKLTLDRIDSEGNYEPGNLRWATPLQQGRNTKRNRRVIYLGETSSLSEWCEEFDISLQAMNQAAFREPDLTVALHRRVLQKLFGIPLKETRHLTTADLPPTAGKPCTNNRGRAKRTVPAGGG